MRLFAFRGTGSHGETMDKRLLLTLTTLVILAVAMAGCSDSGGGGGGQVKRSPFSYNEGIEGWLEDPEGNSVSKPLNFSSEENLIAITITMTIRDSDETHQETDEGSDPDTAGIELTFLNGTGEESKFSLTTSGDSGEVTKEINLTFEDGVQLGGEIIITANALGGGKQPKGPGGIVPIPGLQYVDQGFYYSIQIDYTLLEDPSATKESSPE